MSEDVNLQVIRGMSDQIVKMLETSKTNIEAIISSIPGIVAIIRRDGTIFKGNETLSRLLNCDDVESLIYCNFLDLFASEEREAINSQLSLVQNHKHDNTGEESFFSVELEVDKIHPEHKIPITYLLNLRTYERKLPSGENLFLILGKDVTALRKHSIGLEDIVAERTADLQAKTDDINAMLQNMSQGIFTVTQDLTVHPEYSRHMINIFGHDQIAGVNVMDLLFEHAQMGIDQRDKIRCVLQACLGEDDFTFMFNHGDLPTEIICNINNQRCILELGWNPIYSENDLLEKILVNVRDVTEFRKLQEASQEKEKTLGIVHGILAVSMKNFEVFIKNSYQMIEENRTIINGPKDMDCRDIETLFRHMHTIKGNARVFGYQGVADSAHEAEETYSQILKQEAPVIDPDVLRVDLEKVYDEIVFCEKVCDEKLKSVMADSANDLKEEIGSIINEYKDDNVINNHLLVKRVQHTIEHHNLAGIREVIKEVSRHSSQIADRLGKAHPHITIPDDDFYLPDEMHNAVQNALVHCLTNAIDHGIETSEVRKNKNKEQSGHIKFSIVEMDSHIELIIEDDGQGLDLNKIQHKAAENGILTDELADANLIKNVFEVGFSTATEVTDSSGRGIGLNAVNIALQKHGGEIRVEPTAEPCENRYLPVRFVICLPKVEHEE